MLNMEILEEIVLRSDRSQYLFKIDKPNICPVCEQSGNHTLIATGINQVDSMVSITLECTECYELFFALYCIVPERKNFGVGEFRNSIDTKCLFVLPFRKQANNLPIEIQNVYPVFDEIYSQALEAESKGLHLITGIAFRKSVEFLVKQYLIDSEPSEELKIRKEPLGESIKRIQFPLIQKLAKAATWIGNDEGHFTKKHSDYDVSDIKRFILSLCHLLVAEKVAEDTNLLFNKT